MSGLPPIATVELTSRFGSFVPTTDPAVPVSRIAGVADPKPRYAVSQPNVTYRSTSVQWPGPSLYDYALGCNRRCSGRQDNARSSPMRTIDANTLSGSARDTAGSTSSFANVAHRLVKDLFSGYRPELHYMRGPGPKWRAKHQPWSTFDF
jgi:hypothetical protein